MDEAIVDLYQFQRVFRGQAEAFGYINLNSFGHRGRGPIIQLQLVEAQTKLELFKVSEKALSGRLIVLKYFSASDWSRGS